MGQIPRMHEIKSAGNKSAETEGNKVGFAHIFAAVHDLDRRDFEGFSQTEGGDGTAGFVMDIENVKRFKFGVGF